MRTKDEIQTEIDRLEKERDQQANDPLMWHFLNARMWALKWVLKTEG